MGTDCRDRILRASESERIEIVSRVIEEEVLDLMGWDVSHRFLVEGELFEIGLDSLHAVELQFRLEQRIGYAASPANVLVLESDVKAVSLYVLKECVACWNAEDEAN